MATKKMTPSKKGNLRDLPKSRKELPSDQAKGVKGGAGAGKVTMHDITVSKRTDTASAD
jgi:hypothetical protein